MIIESSIKVKNYKCFGDEPAGFDRILPINVIIGKNNSGKSSLIDLVSNIVKPDLDFYNTGKKSERTEIHVTVDLNVDTVALGFEKTRRGAPIAHDNHYSYGVRYVGKKFKYSIGPTGERTFLSLEDLDDFSVKDLLQGIAKRIKTPLAGKSFRKIGAERDIVPEMDAKHFDIKENGQGATNLVAQVINNRNLDSRLITQFLLAEINRIVEPDIHFKNVIVQKDDKDYWEVYFEDNEQQIIALSKMGSGIKTILLVLLNILILPRIEKKEVSGYVFAFEELENNLHPSLQRRLFSYIRQFSINNNVYFFITTHSNVVIDSFGQDENAQIIHVKNIDGSSFATTALGYRYSKQILEDLDVRASDLLQSNCIIWVEGPSDRNYINKWLELYDPLLIEGTHYSIMYYGGRILSNLCFDFDWLQRELIPLLRINTNAFVVIDRDGRAANAALNSTKQRIQEEIGDDNCWITKGREIENYLSDKAVLAWLSSNNHSKANFHNQPNMKLEDNIATSNRSLKISYEKAKKVLSKEISIHIKMEDLNVLDLSARLKQLSIFIRASNSLRQV